MKLQRTSFKPFTYKEFFTKKIPLLFLDFVSRHSARLLHDTQEIEGGKMKVQRNYSRTPRYFEVPREMEKKVRKS